MESVDECGDFPLMTRSGKPFSRDTEPNGHDSSDQQVIVDSTPPTMAGDNNGSIADSLVKLTERMSAMADNMDRLAFVFQTRAVDTPPPETTPPTVAAPTAVQEDAPSLPQPHTRNLQHFTKFPPFTGTESWEVWLNRFEDVLGRHQLSDTEKLDVLLPKIQGPAGDFVFGQLSRDTRSNFRILIRELGLRYHKVENTKLYMAMFRARGQKRGESIEDYVADLKHVYDKAYRCRDERTRQEDLLRRFLDGLEDEATQFHVEYIKDPGSIDEAAQEVLHYLATKGGALSDFRKASKSVRALKFQEETEGDSESDHRLARTPGRPSRNPGPSTGTEQEPDCLGELNKLKEELLIRLQKLESVQVDPGINEILTRLKKLEKESAPSTQQHGGPTTASTTGGQRNRPKNDGNCYKCGQHGHFARNCVYVSGQLQVSKQPTASFHEYQAMMNPHNVPPPPAFPNWPGPPGHHMNHASGNQ